MTTTLYSIYKQDLFELVYFILLLLLLVVFCWKPLLDLISLMQCCDYWLIVVLKQSANPFNQSESCILCICYRWLLLKCCSSSFIVLIRFFFSIHIVINNFALFFMSFFYALCRKWHKLGSTQWAQCNACFMESSQRYFIHLNYCYCLVSLTFFCYLIFSSDDHFHHAVIFFCKYSIFFFSFREFVF